MTMDLLKRCGAERDIVIAGRQMTADHRHEQWPSHGLSGKGEDADPVDRDLVSCAEHDPGDGMVTLQAGQLGSGVPCAAAPIRERP